MGRILVIREDQEPAGASVTNRAEDIVSDVCRLLNLTPVRFRVFVHRPYRANNYFDSPGWEELILEFDWDSARFRDPVWSRLGLGEVPSLMKLYPDVIKHQIWTLLNPATFDGSRAIVPTGIGLCTAVLGLLLRRQIEPGRSSDHVYPRCRRERRTGPRRGQQTPP